MTVVLDSEPLSLLARQDAGMQAVVTAARALRQRVVVPAVVLAEVMTGRPTDAAVWHTVSRLVVVDVTAALASRAGALRSQAGAVRAKKRDLTLDAIVAAVAESLAPATILTGDPADFALLTANTAVRVAPLG